jgi:hypothetical protein
LRVGPDENFLLTFFIVLLTIYDILLYYTSSNITFIIKDYTVKRFFILVLLVLTFSSERVLCASSSLPSFVPESEFASYQDFFIATKLKECIKPTAYSGKDFEGECKRYLASHFKEITIAPGKSSFMIVDDVKKNSKTFTF